MASFLGGLWDTISGSGQIKSAAKAGKKAAKVQQTTSREQLNQGQDLYAEQKAAAAAALPQQQAYLASGNRQAQNALTGDLNRQQALFGGQNAALDPYLQYGNQSINALGGFSGANPEQSQGMLQNFENSPLYQAVFQNALDQGTQALDRRAGANRMYNSGRAIKGIANYAGGLGGNTFLQYVDQLNKGVGVGQTAAGQRGALTGQASNAYGNNAQLSASAYNNLGANQSNALGSYVNNLGQYGNLLSNNQQAGYGNLLAGQGAQGSASAAGHMGLANTMQGMWSGAANLAGNALGAYTGGLGMAAGGSAPWWQNALSSIPGNSR